MLCTKPDSDIPPILWTGESWFEQESTDPMPRTNPTYSTEFRQQAVDLLLSSGRPLKHVAKELGICAASLAHWRNTSLRHGRTTQAASKESKGRSAAPVTDPVIEIRRLQREVDYLRRQRDILKKAMSILSEDPQSGMR